MRVFSCVLLFLLVHHQAGASGDGDLLISYSDGESVSIARNSPFITDVRKIKPNAFPLRKCCPPGKVYHQMKHGGQNATEKCRDHANAYQQSVLIDISQELFLPNRENGSISNDGIKLNITSGFPENCKEMMLLEPDSMPSDRFYPLQNGNLVVPSRFWIFPPESHCMEDFYAEDYNRIKRVAIICADNALMFPSDAINEKNRLQLNFIDDLNMTKSLTDLLGQRVIRKCCDINEVYSVQSSACIPKQSYATQYFDDLLRENDNLFVRTGPLTCPDQDIPEVFEWTEDFEVRIKRASKMPWDKHLYTSEEYCVEDFVTFLNDELPEVITLVTICPKTNKTTDENYIEDKVTVPKCCFRGYIIDGSCVEIEKFHPQEPKLELNLKGTIETLLLQNPFPAKVELVNELSDNLGCGYNNLQPLPLYLSHSPFRSPIPRFRVDEQRITTFIISYYQENNRTFDVRIANFCVDTVKIQAQQGKNASYEPHVFFCFLPSHNSGQHPAMLLISSIALIFTCFMYILTPVKGDAINDRLQSDASQDTMASQVTGRNLLCHISSLCLAFVCLAVAQQGLVKPGDSGCIAIGYITYGATIASFTWFTVYCFHSFCMFRETARNNIVFVPYLLFGWGIPVMALVIASVAQFHPKSSLPQSINPNMGSLRCWFGNETSLLVFFYVPICFLLGLSIIFLLNLLLNYILRFRARKTTESRQRNIQSSIRMAMKFIIITGIPWVFEAAVWMPSYFANVPKQRESLQHLSEVGSVLNALRGVFIFSLFVLFQPNVRAQLFFFLVKIYRKVNSLAEQENQKTDSASSERNNISRYSTASSATNNSTSTLSKNEEQLTSKVQPTSFEPCDVTVL